MKKTDYYVREVLSKKNKSIAFFFIVGIAGFVILNILITLTNRLDNYRNTVSVALVIAFLVILFLLIERIITLNVYMLSNDRIGFARRIGSKENIIIEIPFKNITDIRKIKFTEPNPKIMNTYYFIDGEVNDEDICGEFISEEKLYRFVFSPSERIMRILQKKLF